MKKFESMRCPVCEAKLHVRRLFCPKCKSEYCVDEEFSPIDYLNGEQKSFLITFLKCAGNIKAMEAELNVSYPTVKNDMKNC